MSSIHLSAPKLRKRNVARPSCTSSQISSFDDFSEPCQSSSSLMNPTQPFEMKEQPFNLKSSEETEASLVQYSETRASYSQITDYFTEHTMERTSFINEILLHKVSLSPSLIEYDETNLLLKQSIANLRIVSTKAIRSVSLPKEFGPIFSTLFSPGVIPHPEKRIAFFHSSTELFGVSGSLTRGRTPPISLRKNNLPMMLTAISCFSDKDWIALGGVLPSVWVFDYEKMHFVQESKPKNKENGMTLAVQVNQRHGLVTASLDDGRISMMDPRMCGECLSFDPETQLPSTSIDSEGMSFLQLNGGRAFLWDIRSGKYIQNDCGTNEHAINLGRFCGSEGLVVYGLKGENKLSFWDSVAGNHIAPVDLGEGLASISYCSMLNEILVSSQGKTQTKVSVVSSGKHGRSPFLFDCANLPQNLVDCSVNDSGSLFTGRSLSKTHLFTFDCPLVTNRWELGFPLAILQKVNWKRAEKQAVLIDNSRITTFIKVEFFSSWNCQPVSLSFS